MEKNLEYIKLFAEYESDDMPVVYFYEIDLDDDRFMLREMEVFMDRTVRTDEDPYRDVIEAVPIPPADEFNAKVWGEGFYATVIPKEEFDEIWDSGVYDGDLSTS